jgi:hypothetical protein
LFVHFYYITSVICIHFYFKIWSLQLSYVDDEEEWYENRAMGKTANGNLVCYKKKANL